MAIVGRLFQEVSTRSACPTEDVFEIAAKPGKTVLCSTVADFRWNRQKPSEVRALHNRKNELTAEPSYLGICIWCDVGEILVI